LILSATVGVLLGWPVAGVAFLPYAIAVLLSPRLMRSIAVLGLVFSVTLGCVAMTDAYFYGRPTVRCHFRYVNEPRVMSVQGLSPMGISVLADYVAGTKLYVHLLVESPAL
jgi:hypothetical protein